MNLGGHFHQNIVGLFNSAGSMAGQRLTEQVTELRILHLLGSIDDEAAGPSVSVPRLAEAQARIGADVCIATVGGSPELNQRVPGVRHLRFKHSLAALPLFRKLRFSSELQRFLSNDAAALDVVHTHGLWLAPNFYPSVAAKRGSCFVVSPRGMLGGPALQFSSWKKRLIWYAAQKRAINHASLIHATSEEEKQDVRDFGITTPVTVVANGVDIPAAPHDCEQNPRREVLSLGRVHPKKGLDRLIKAWSEIQNDFPDWHLRIVGPSELGHAADLERLVARMGCRRVSFEGPIYGEEKLRAYRSAGVFVLPTLHENFGMTVAEALAAGTPVISTKGAPWSGLDNHQCGRWIDHGSGPLAIALRDLLQLSDSRRLEMGLRGRAWMTHAYSWQTAATSLLTSYQDAIKAKHT